MNADIKCPHCGGTGVTSEPTQDWRIGLKVMAKRKSLVQMRRGTGEVVEVATGSTIAAHGVLLVRWSSTELEWLDADELITA